MNTSTFIEKLVEKYPTVYSTKDKYNDVLFLKVQNNNNAVLTITIPKNDRELEYKGVSITSPIKPNITTGSAVQVTHENVSLNTALDVVEKYMQVYPHFFSAEDKRQTVFQTIEQAVELHGNPLNFIKIK